MLLVLTLVGVSLLISSLMLVLPGDYVDVMLGTQQELLTERQVEALREVYGVNKPWIVRYWDWIKSIFQGSMGFSLRSGNPVSTEIAYRLPVSFELAGFATILAAFIGIPLGVLSAVSRDKVSDFFIRITGLVGLSIPRFWLGLMIIFALSTYFNWLPAMGQVENLFTNPLKNLSQFAFPVLSLAVALAAALMRITRSSMLEELQKDYIQTARSKGLLERFVLLKHGLKNAFIPVLTLAGMQMGYLIGGAIVIESVFSLPGIGTLLINGVHHRNYPVVQGTVLIIALLFALINLITDILYATIDPRIRYS